MVRPVWAMVLVTLFVGVVQDESLHGAVKARGSPTWVRESFSAAHTAFIL